MLIFAIAMMQSAFSMEWGPEEEPAKSRKSATVPKGVGKNNCELILQKIQQGAPADMKIDENGNTVLHCLLYRSKNWKAYHSVSIASIISKLAFFYQADVDAQNNDGITPLHLAALVGDINIIRALLDAGADKSIEDNAGYTPYDLAAGIHTDKKILGLLKPDTEMDENTELDEDTQLDEDTGLDEDTEMDEVTEMDEDTEMDEG